MFNNTKLLEFKKIFQFFLVFFLLGLSFYAQSARACDDCGKASDSNHKLQVFTSIKPLHSIVANISQGVFTPKLLIDRNISPHVYSITPKTTKKLYNADAIFFIDETFETFLDDVLIAAPTSLKQFQVSKGSFVDLFHHREGGAWEEHLDDHHHEGSHDGHDEHDHSDEFSSKSHFDMHFWLSPKNAEKMAKYVAKELVNLDKENAKKYRKNRDDFIKKLRALDKELAKKFKDFDGKPFIVFHDAYRYFEERYNLNAVGSITIDTRKKVSLKRVNEIKKKIKSTNAACIFREPQFDSSIVKMLSKETGIKTGVLDPIGSNIKPSEGLYFKLLRNLGENLYDCLSS